MPNHQFKLTADHLYQWWQGRWALSRVLPQQASARGLAIFTRTSSCTLRYHETVQVRWPHGFTSQAHRSYHYHFIDQGVQVTFAEGGAFHQINFDQEPTTVVATLHRCRADRYQPLYRFQPPNDWSLSYRVTGPQKSHWLRTDYQRLDP